MAEVVLVVHRLTEEVAETETVEQAEMAGAAEQPVLETASPAQTTLLVPTVVTAELGRTDQTALKLRRDVRCKLRTLNLFF